jgi:anaerobic magnesium-protoporphyrin IX monomethyl ester cyclase
MDILLINVPHPLIGSRIPDDHLPPLGLLSIGGPLIDDGHEVRLIDGEFGPMSREAIVAEARAFRPDVVLFGHSGSTSGHPVIADIASAIAAALPLAEIVHGGVFPTYHWREILAEEPYVSAIVRGEGEETARRLMRALQVGKSLSGVDGIAYRDALGPRATRPARQARLAPTARSRSAAASFRDHPSPWRGDRPGARRFAPDSARCWRSGRYRRA